MLACVLWLVRQVTHQCYFDEYRQDCSQSHGNNHGSINFKSNNLGLGDDHHYIVGCHRLKLHKRTDLNGFSKEWPPALPDLKGMICTGLVSLHGVQEFGAKQDCNGSVSER